MGLISKNSNEYGAPIWNSNFKPNLNSNKGEEKKNRKRKSLSQPKQPTGPDSPSWLHWPTHSRSRPAHELVQAQQPARTPLTPTRLPAFACSRCHTGPACQPSCSSSPRHAPTAHVDSFPRPSPDSAGRGGPGGHARGMALSPWRRAHDRATAPVP